MFPMNDPGRATLTRRHLLASTVRGALAAGALVPAAARGTEPPIKPGAAGSSAPGYRIQLDVIIEGYDRKTDWFQPRVGVIPPSTVVVTMTRAQLWGSDIFTAVQEMRSDDFGRTWSQPRAHATLDRRKLLGGAETVDVVALSEAERINFHRLRLLRDSPLRAGSFLDAKSIEEKRRAGQLGRAVLEVLQNDTCQLLWLGDFPVEMVGQVLPAAVEGLKQSRARRAALEAALAKGELVVDQEVSEKDCNDQASLHGVAQSFVPSRDGSCPLVQIYAAIRGSGGPLPPPIHVEIRGDAKGKPGAGVLAKTEIPAAELGLEPAYRWGSAQWNPPLPLKKGQTYWIYLTNKSHPDGNYVWRLLKDAAGPRGHAWSQRYDYTQHTWVFRVYLKQEPSK